MGWACMGWACMGWACTGWACTGWACTRLGLRLGLITRRWTGGAA